MSTISGMPGVATERTERIDTTVSEVAVWGNDGSSPYHAARNHILSANPNATVLAIWRTHQRNSNGWPVFAVEWEEVGS